VADALRNYGVDESDVDVISIEEVITRRRRLLGSSDTIDVTYYVTFYSYTSSAISGFLSEELTSTGFLTMLQSQTGQSGMSSSGFSFTLVVKTQYPTGNQH
jgi:hypothetical protein